MPNFLAFFNVFKVGTTLEAASNEAPASTLGLTRGGGVLGRALAPHDPNESTLKRTFSISRSTTPKLDRITQKKS